MDDYSQKLKCLNDRAVKILETGQVFWNVPDTGSLLLIDLHNEFGFHWVTCTSSLTESLTKLIKWYLKEQAVHPAIGLAILHFDRGMDALQAPSIVRFLKLTLIIAENLVALGVPDQIKNIVEVMAMLKKIQTTWKLGKPDLAPLAKLLPQVELAMEQMMLASLYFEMTADRITTKSSGPSNAVSLLKLKAPVIHRLQAIRARAAESAYYTPSRFSPIAEGFWPAGLRGNVSDIVLLQPSA
jgi:hypothetical protein